MCMRKKTVVGCASYPGPERSIPLGEVGVNGAGPLAILTYGNGHYLSTQAAKTLQAEGIETRIIDMRWLAPNADGTVS